jgi:hypothetical protein
VKQDTYATLGVIAKGRLQVQNRAGFDAAMARFPDGVVVVEVKLQRPQRSSQQNRFWHGVVIPLFAEHCGYDLLEMKDVLALRLIPKEVTDMNGERQLVPGHTADLNVKDFNDLIERAQRLGAELGIYVPDPNEVAA